MKYKSVLYVLCGVLIGGASCHVGRGEYFHAGVDFLFAGYAILGARSTKK
jgi:hypothetical protein